ASRAVAGGGAGPGERAVKVRRGTRRGSGVNPVVPAGSVAGSAQSGAGAGLADGADPPRRRPERAGVLAVVGSLLTMAGLIGALLSSALGTASSGHGGLFVIGSGNLP